jgi:hypothetical protein
VLFLATDSPLLAVPVPAPVPGAVLTPFPDAAAAPPAAEAGAEERSAAHKEAAAAAAAEAAAGRAALEERDGPFVGTVPMAELFRARFGAWGTVTYAGCFC